MDCSELHSLTPLIYNHTSSRSLEFNGSESTSKIRQMDDKIGTLCGYTENMQIVSPQAERPGKLSEPGGIRLLFFGPVQLTRDGVPLAFPYDNVQALLVYLAVENRRIHRRSVLAGLLWPDQPEQAARHSLAQALYSLRRVLGDGGASPLLRTTRETV
jgi:hypothetical protein